MALPVQLPTLQVYRGDVFERAVQFNDAAGDPIDLTAYGTVWKAQARVAVASSTAYDFTIDSTDAAAGKITLTLPAAVTATLPAAVGFDVQVAPVSGDPTTLLAGLIEVSGEWTR